MTDGEVVEPVRRVSLKYLGDGRFRPAPDHDAAVTAAIDCDQLGRPVEPTAEGWRLAAESLVEPDQVLAFWERQETKSAIRRQQRRIRTQGEVGPW